MFVNPTCIDVDHKGRVWVCESVNYRCDLRKVKRNRLEGDRLIVLEDTDGDGKADKAHTFYQEKDVIAPLGVAVAPNPDGKGLKVYVCHSPHIYVFEDADGDLKADGPPKVLLTGFRGYDHDHGVHGIHFGPDGKLYFSVGDQGVQNLKAAPASTVASAPREKSEAPRETKSWTTNQTDCRAGTIWRCNPDGTNLELLAHNFRNPYEPAVDSFGAIFTSDNDDDGNQQTRICYVMPGGNYGYHPRGKGESHWHEEQPGVVHKVLRTGFGSPTGMCWYEGDLLRKAMMENARPRVFERAGSDGARQPSPMLEDSHGGVYGLLLHTDAGPREVRCFIVKTKGAGYELEQVNLVTSSDNWFRPSDVCVAPDGSIFVSDWYDPGVGGHGMGDTTRGRIYRLTAKGQKGYKVPAYEVKTGDGFVRSLASPNLAARQMARLKYVTMERDESVGIRLQCAGGKAPLYVRANGYWLAIYTHHGLFGGENTDDLRIVQIRLQHDRSLPSPAPFRFFDVTSRRWYKHASIQVRRELLVALRSYPPEMVSDLIYDSASLFDAQDPFYLAAINIAVGTDPKRRDIILADFEKHFPAWNDKVAKLVWELRPPQVIAKLDQKLADPKLSDAQKAQILDILAVSDANAGKVLLRVLASNPPRELRQTALKNLLTHLPAKWSSLRGSDEHKQAALELFKVPETRASGIELLAVGEIPQTTSILFTVCAGEKQPPDAVLAAVRALGNFTDEEALKALQYVLEKRPSYRKEALSSLGRMQTTAALAVLQAKLKGDQADDAVEPLASSRTGTIWLLDAHARKELPETLIPEAGRLLRNSPYQDLRNRALIAFPAPGKLDPKKLPAIASLLKRNGDVPQGRKVYATNKDLGCIRCHTIRGTGGQIGPDLSMIGKKASRENLFESILQPDKAVADQYIRWVVATADGVTLDGLIVEETGEHVILRDANGKDTKLPKSDITGRKKSPNSLMPSDLLAHMTEQDLVDLVAYMETLKTPALSIDGWHILGPFDNGSGDEGLEKAHLPEKILLDGSTRNKVIGLNAEYEGKHGKVTRKLVRPNGEGYVDLAAHCAPQNQQIVSYLWKEIESPVDQDATILIGTDDGCKLWLNGKEVLSHRRHESATPERDKVPIKLKEGRNTILLKINNGDGPHGFYFSVVSEQELKTK
jgi:putative membrane-bound dehydrogenase-like protein